MNLDELLTPAEYERAIEQNPSDPTNYWRLGLVLLLSGDREMAQMVWLSGLAAVEPEQVDFWQADLIDVLTTAATAAIDRREFTSVAAICEQQLELGDDRAETYHLLAQAQSQQGDYDGAIEAWQQAIARQPNFVAAHIQQAEVWQKLANWKAAIASYTAAIELAPSAPVLLELGRCYLNQNQVERAIEPFQQAAQLQPDWAAAYGEWGCALRRQGDQEGAIAKFQQAMQLAEFSSSALLDRVSALDINPAQDEAIAPEETSVPAPIGFDESMPFTAIDPAIEVKLKPPRSINSSLHFSFRFGSAIELPATFVTTISNGRFWINSDESSCACITPDDRFVPVLSPEFPIFSPGHPDNHPRHHSILKRSGLPPIERIDGTVAVLSSLQNNLYFHWMLEVLPRWNLLKRGAIDLNSIDYFLVPNGRSFQQETLMKLGISPAKVISPKQHIQADRLVMSFPGCIAWPTRSTCEFLRSTFLPSSLPRNCRLYISRAQTANRRVTNEAEIVDLLEQYGFESVTLETLSVGEQAALFASANVVVAPHGSGLTNLVFCQSGTTVIELFSPNFVYPCYWFISNLVELDYYYLLGEMPLGASVHNLLYPDARIADISIDSGNLLKQLQAAGVI